jgi:hypothetical protein
MKFYCQKTSMVAISMSSRETSELVLSTNSNQEKQGPNQKSKRVSLLFLTLLLCSLAPKLAYGQGTFTSTANGNWSSTLIWTISGTDYNNNGYPDGQDNAVINNNVSIDVPSLSVNGLTINSNVLTLGVGNLTANSLSITDGATIDASSTGFLLTVGGLTINSGAAGAKSTIGASNCPAFAINGTTNIYGYLSWAPVPSGAQTFNGTVNLNSGGTFDNSSGVTINLNGNVTNNGSWLAPASNTGGLYHVTNAGSYTYSGSTAIRMVELSIDVAATVTNQGSLYLSNASGVGLNVIAGGSFINGNGGYLNLSSAGACIANAGTVNFSTATNEVDYSCSNGSNQTIFATTYSKLTVSGAGNKTLANATIVNTTFSTSSTAILDDGGFKLSGTANMNMTGTSQIRFRYATSNPTLPLFSGGSYSFASGTTIELTGAAAQTLASSGTFPYQNVQLDGSNVVSMANVSSIAGNLTVVGSASFNNNPVLIVGGTTTYSSNGSTTLLNNLTTGSFVMTSNSGVFSYSGKTLTINGNNGQWYKPGTGTLTHGTAVFTTGTGQTIGGTNISFLNLNINNANDVTLTSSITVNTALTLTAGRIITGSNTLTCNGSVSRTSGFVEGYLQKPGPISTINFEVGTGTVYSPLQLTVSTFSATYITVSVTATNDPNISFSIIDPTKSVNRYWTVIPVGGSPVIKPKFTYSASDYSASANYANFNYSYFNQTTFAWTNVVPSTTPPNTPPYASATLLDDSSSPGFNLTSTYRFQIGEVLFTPTDIYYTRLRGSLNWSSSSTWINNRSGTITYTAGSTAVSGSSTKFTKELSVNDYIMDQLAPGTVIGQVASIASDVSLTLVSNATASGTGINYGRQKVPNGGRTDIVHIGNGNISSPSSTTAVTLDQDATVYSLDFARNGQGVTLTHNTGTKMTIYSSVTVGVSTSGTAGKVSSWSINDGVASVGGTITLGSGSAGVSHFAKIVLTNGSLSVNGNISFSMTSATTSDQSQVLDLGTSGTLNLGGNFVFSASSLASLLPSSPTNSTINFNGFIAQNLNYPSSNTTTSSWVYPNIVCNNASTSGVILNKTWGPTTGSSAYGFNGNLRVQSGILDLSGYTITGQAGKSFQIDPGATLKITNNGTTDSSFPSGFSTYNLGTTSPFGNVYYNVSNSFTLPSSVTFGNLTQSSSGAGSFADGSNTVAGSLTSNGVGGIAGPGTGGTLSVGGDFTISSVSAVDATNLSSVTIGGSWFDDGVYASNTETLTFAGKNYAGGASLQPIKIAGASPEVFYNLNINSLNSTDIVQLQKDNVQVSNILSLTNGGLDLNGHNISVTNNSTAAITRSGSSYIKSETTSYPYSNIQWTLGGTTGSYIFPFGRSSTEYIPFTFQVTSSSSADGVLSVGTYHTAADNTPYPQGVTNMNGPSGTDISKTNVVDRFWIITPSSFNSYPTAKVTFTATPAEITNSSGSSLLNLLAQRWSPGNTWDKPLTQTSLAYGSTVPNVSNFSPWTLTGDGVILPIEVSDFKAYLLENKTVQLHWETKSEVNNNYFILEKSTNGKDFIDFLRIDGSGTTNVSHAYSVIDQEPFSGLSYYRLKQVDFDGQFKNAGNTVSVFVDSRNLSVFPNPVKRGEKLTIQLPANSFDQVLTITDSFGKELLNTEKQTQNAETSIDILTLESFSEGIYFIILKYEGGIIKAKFLVTK